MTLKEKLADWTEWDGAAFGLAVSLGLMEGGVDSWLKNKAVFWSNNPVGEALGRFLQELVKADVLEYREEPDQQYRWKDATR